MNEIVISLGEPIGINVEVLIKSFSKLMNKDLINHRFILVGCHSIFMEQLKALKLNLPFRVKKVERLSELNDHMNDHLFYDISRQFDHNSISSCLNPSNFSQLLRGQISVSSLKQSLLLNPKQLLTMPVNKFYCQQFLTGFTGHTGFLRKHYDSEATMLLAGPLLRVSLLTEHIPLNKVFDYIGNQELFFNKLDALRDGLKKYFCIENPKIAICAVNPHVGDNGSIANDDNEIIKPIIDRYNKAHPRIGIVGPISADTAFYFASKGDFDAVLAIYHDQGLGPLKTLHFFDAINITCGLPICRVSPDHGPAENLYLKGEANEQSTFEALKFLLRLNHIHEEKK